tara:strand:+ start:472 stop:1680 length:1209 start_codon:yes stop_codon:yes gene_type:complete
MHLRRNKKSLVKATIISILILSAGFILILGILKMFASEAEDKTAESICKASVVLREKTYTKIEKGFVEFGSVASPLMCKTIDKNLPENKDATKEHVKRQFANLMTSCWNQFGEGLIKDVFKQGNPFMNNCFICSTVSLSGTKKFKEPISQNEFLEYLFTTPYKINEESDGCKVGGGFCIDSENKDACNIEGADIQYVNINKKSTICKKQGKTSCCYTGYECWDKGGKCEGSNNNPKYTQYDNWRCPSDLKCFVKKENYYSYGEYFQSFGGEGKILLGTDIKPGETYAISFGSPTEDECDWCTSWGLGGAAIGAAGGAAAGIYAITLIASGPIGWAVLGTSVIGLTATTTVVGGLTGYAFVGGAAELAKDIGVYFIDRKFPMIYLTTLDQINEGSLCSNVKDT